MMNGQPFDFQNWGREHNAYILHLEMRASSLKVDIFFSAIVVLWALGVLMYISNDTVALIAIAIAVVHSFIVWWQCLSYRWVTEELESHYP